jgi:hypothetical protein
LAGVPDAGELRHWAGGLVGAAVAAEIVVAHTPDTACVIRHITATSEGIAFVLVVRLREPLRATAKRSSTERFWRALSPLLVNPKSTSQSAVRFHVEFSDGRAFEPPWELRHAGSSSDDVQAEFRYWLPALPPKDGTISFVFDWKPRGILDARAELQSRPVLAAARRAKPLFAPPN